MLDNIPSPRSENQHGARSNAWRPPRHLVRVVHSTKDVVVRRKLVAPSRTVSIIEVDLDGLNIRVQGRHEVGSVGRCYITELQMTVPVGRK